jgi:hypothetical protein
LTLISRAFSSASCLMKATCRRMQSVSHGSVLITEGIYTILFISLRTSSSFSGLEAMNTIRLDKVYGGGSDEEVNV